MASLTIGSTIPTHVALFHATCLEDARVSKPRQRRGMMSNGWAPGSWRARPARQIPKYPDAAALEKTERALASFPPLVFAGEARKLEERLGEAAMGRAFLLQGGDYAENFKEFGANNIRNTFRLMLQMAVVLTFGGRMPTIKVLLTTIAHSHGFVQRNLLRGWQCISGWKDGWPICKAKIKPN
ncbi:hypothetical protein E2562_000980 [Oryza meyeriana var. granulata]|uniref:Phospho-2-dehydro-3-deoxyheptonate aldolase n=1 Tax=Oryza meyeriana var. granulata TaxID=110450 RepID=A0A6G1CYM7_9ORYZ|nr:hypothetical protein E2562_000980 [Oryza meyeriana var. granulata]